MSKRLFCAALMALVAVVIAPSLIHARDLSFEDRVAAQAAIERVYYSHLTDAKRSFEEAVPRSVLERKVRDYLGQSLALESMYRSPITATALRREVERIAHDTHFPERLGEIYSALGNDPILVEECFARPALADRWLRSFVAHDERVQGSARRAAEALRAGLLRGEVDPLEAAPGRSLVRLVRVEGGDEPRAPSLGASGEIELSMDPQEWQQRVRATASRPHGVGDVEEREDTFVVTADLPAEPQSMRQAVYTFSKVPWDVWWRANAARFDAAPGLQVTRVAIRLPRPAPRVPAFFYSCADANRWSLAINSPVPSPRSGHTAVWTGSEMIVWGGVVSAGPNTAYLNTGARYDPLLDRWKPMAHAPLIGRFDHTAVWTGSEMIVFGGRSPSSGPQGDGARYDPVLDLWTPIRSTSGRLGHTAVWTGSSMLVWGGTGDGGTLIGGAAYNPSSDSWSPMSTLNEPPRRVAPSAVWTGSVMVVWGGSGFSGGGRYDPIQNQWAPVSLVGAPAQEDGNVPAMAMAWTGTQVLVWGGSTTVGANTGGRYNPSSDSWLPMSVTGAPTNRSRCSWVWTGSRLIVWGGNDGSGYPQSGGVYDPGHDTWATTSTVNAPSGRDATPAVWSGDRMVLWGGVLGESTGARYDPSSDTWTPTSGPDAPSPRNGETQVWTGTRWVLWGGQDSWFRNALDTGASYDPLTDLWTATPILDAPSARTYHSAIWTGQEMIVWGGVSDSPSMTLNTGARLDPILNTWTATSVTGVVPSLRHGALWTGSLMLVWGGSCVGYRYDPSSDSWTAMSGAGAPVCRPTLDVPLLWTGSEMIAWGTSTSGGLYASGGLYDPDSDSWRPIATNPALLTYGGLPFAGVWTGSRMLAWRPKRGSYADAGGLYDPQTDAWTPVASTSYASDAMPSIVWTGHYALLWYGGNVVRYDPAANTWFSLPTSNPPSDRVGHVAAWTGKEMLVWGGSGLYSHLFPEDAGGAYVPDESPDNDHDTYPTCEDCNDQDSHTWVFPPDVATLIIRPDANGTALYWDVVGVDPTLHFDLRSGPLAGSAAASLGSSVCLTVGTPFGGYDSRPDPAQGTGVWYLVRASTGCGTTSFGTPQRDALLAPCP